VLEGCDGQGCFPGAGVGGSGKKGEVNRFPKQKNTRNLDGSGHKALADELDSESDEGCLDLALRIAIISQSRGSIQAIRCDSW
jgi:hypothetical protein